MQITESEADTLMMIPIDTDKFEAIRAITGAPVGTAPSVVWGKLMDILALYDVYHRARGWVDAKVFKLEAKQKNS